MYIPLGRRIPDASVIAMTGAFGRISLMWDSLFAKRGFPYPVVKLSGAPQIPCKKIIVAVCAPLAGTTTLNQKQYVIYQEIITHDINIFFSEFRC